MRVLMVCSGNICRSPTAETVLRQLADERGLTGLEVDSAGTGGWHVGEPPDERAVAAARRRGYDVGGVARQVGPRDFDAFDLVLAVDDENLRQLRRQRPPGSRAELRLLGDGDVPDPYYGGPDGFDRVLDLVEKYCAALLDELDVRQD